ncbi:uncharacterized protein LOC120419357 isoform X2 [Culex pipiens pallens]|uniref:uncharacterized protein LOC120419357 isoform X2 n=1 Tax=Culex pipiens pallens TaxID=42434 RepID=UPI0022AAB428|nr:uncharacterized protein LOC120419357 isoform X2 [Culex pipiens pallens]
MSQSPPNYMEGVPVKISERFRPPPKVTLPQSVINRLAQVDGGGSSSSRIVPSYDFELEETVLKRIGEWRAAKDKQLYERGERIRRKELELARLAEEEQKHILAQVLNLNAPSSGSERSPEETNDSKPKPIEEAVATTTTTTIDQATVPTVQQPQYSYGQTAQQYQPGTYSMPTQPQQQQPPSSNDYYKSYNSYHYNYCAYTPTSTSTATSCYTPTSGAVAAATVPYHSPSTQYQYQPTAAQYSYYPYTSAATAGNSPATQPTYAHNYLYNNAAAAASYYNYPAGQSATPADEASSLRSKSKSVPDIVRQLDEEVQDSALRRTRNNSQSTAERRLEDDEPTVHTPAVTTGSNARTDFTLYNQLSAGEQNLVKRIGSMGFPLERVAAVLKRLGSDDKKIVEHLIPLSELLDLGFEEEKISEALVKFGNNKHKALDYLIS